MGKKLPTEVADQGLKNAGDVHFQFSLTRLLKNLNQAETGNLVIDILVYFF